MHHPALGMLMDEVAQVGLKPEQQAAVDAIQADLEKQADTLKAPNEQLSSDLADGVSAGKLDKTKVDADTKKLAQAADATVKAVQDAANKLHQTLDAAQRKKLVDLVRAKAEEMHAHGMGPMHGPEGMPGHEHEHGPGAAGMGPKGGAAPQKGEPAAASKPEAAPGAQGHTMEHGGQGPAGMGHHEHAMEHGGQGPAGMGHPDMHMHGGIEHLSETLGLTQDQRDKLKAKVDAQAKSHMAAMKSEHAAMEKRMKSIADAFESDKFDAKKAGIGEKHGDMIKNMVKGRVEFVEAVLSVLTPEQRAKFAEHIKQFCEMCDEAK